MRSPDSGLFNRSLLAGALLFGTLAGCAGQSAEEQRNNQPQSSAATQIASHPELTRGQVSAGGQQLHYRSIGTARSAVAIWIHGTPGGWADIRRLMIDSDFTDKVRIVSVDRPGWGNSVVADESTFRWGNFEDHSKAFTPLLQRLRNEHRNVPIVLVGHSWGGSFVPTLAADHSDQVSGVLVLAGSIDPELSGPRWYNRLGNTWLVKKFLGRSLLNANREIYALRQQVEAQAPRLSTLSMPVVFIQGTNDKLVDPRNSDYAERNFNPANSRVIRLQDQGHLLQVERTPLIGRCILAVAAIRLERCHE